MDDLGAGELCAWISKLDSGESQAVFSKEGPCFVGPGRELGMWGETWDGSVAPSVSHHQSWHGPRKQPDIHGQESQRQGSPVAASDTLGGTPGPIELKKALPRRGCGRRDLGRLS